MNNSNCRKTPFKRGTLMQTKILAKFQVYILLFSYFTATLSICYLHSVLSVKSSFCEHWSSKHGHSFNN